MHRYGKIKDFHGSRALGVGSSDIPTLAGLTKRYKNTTLSLWESKTGKAPHWDGNERTRVGHDLEAYVLFRFVEEKFGAEQAQTFYKHKLRDRSWGPFKALTECFHPERKYCLAHADLLVDLDGPLAAGEAYIVEAKTVGAFAAKRREGEIFSGYDLDDRTAQGVPDSVFLQVQWQLYCYGVQTAWVAALIDNQFYKFGPIIADARVQEKCLALATRFWQHVKDSTPPAPETWDDVTRLYPHQADQTTMIGGDEEQKVKEMLVQDKDLAARIKKLEEQRDDIKNAVGILLGQNQILASAEGDILAKSYEKSRESVDLKKIEKDNPKLLKQLAAEGFIKKSSWREVRF